MFWMQSAWRLAIRAFSRQLPRCTHSLTENFLLLWLQLYRSINIRVMLVGLEIWTHKDYIYVDLNSERTLDSFLAWRQADLLKRTKHDTAQFVT